MKITIPFITLLLVTSLQPATGQDWQTEVDSVLTLLHNRGLFNGQVLLAEDGQIRFSKGYGTYESDDNTIEITTDTPLPLASVTKPFTAMDIKMLEERDLLEYSDPISKYLPNLPWHGITLRHLLNQTGNIPRGLEVALEHADTSKIMHNEDIINMLGEVYPNPDFNPGEHFTYNNLNFILLTAVIEKLTKMPYADFMRSNICAPLGMNHTFDRSEKPVPDNMRVGADTFYRAHGTGSMRSTAEDLYRFDQALYDTALVSRSTLQQAFTPPLLANGDSSRYGFGWFIDQQDIGRSIHHLGSSDRFTVYFQRFPELNSTLILNHAYPNRHAKDTYWMIRNIWQGNSYELPTSKVRYDIDPALFEEYVGSYNSNFGLVHVTASGDKLYLRPDPVPGKEELVPSSDSTFYFQHQDIEWQFYRNGNGEVVGFGLKGQPETMGRKVNKK